MSEQVLDTTRNNGLGEVPAESFQAFYRRITGEEWATRYAPDLMRSYVAKHAK